MLRVAPIAALLLSGCPAHTPRAPDVGRAYLEALAEGRSDDAWDRLAPEARRRISPGEHRTAVAALSGERRAQLADQAQRVQSEDITALWSHPGGTLSFEHRGGAEWVVTGGLPRFDRQDAPDEALRTFARALRGSDWETLLKLAPADQRAALSAGILRDRFGDKAVRAEVEAALAALADAGPGEALGPSGWRFLRGRHRADLRLEDGLWRVVDLR